MTNKYLIIGAACAGLGLAYVMYRTAGKAVDMVGDAAQAINPLNNDNVINRGFTSMYRDLTGGTDLGTDIYDALHGGALDWNGVVNPASENNLINQGVSKIGETLGGGKGWSLGGQIYDWTH